MLIPNCTAVIMAGGESTRMGRDKARIPLAGIPLIDHVIAVIAPLFSQIVVSVRAPRAEITLPQLCDQNSDQVGKGRGPMIGIATALEQVETPWVFALACDMPFVSPQPIHCMARKRAGQQVVVPIVDGTVQPLAAFYAKSCLPLMRKQIISGDRSLQRMIARMQTTLVDEAELKRYDPELLSFMDLDCEADIDAAKAVLRRRNRNY
ncbi:MAG: molybdenum cofactor guanylyltransferase [Mariprofundales bacterium]|nr:molybdenum cofactor guanylyltransferase [Mariprofundales bacterium]